MRGPRGGRGDIVIISDWMIFLFLLPSSCSALYPDPCLSRWEDKERYEKNKITRTSCPCVVYVYASSAFCGQMDRWIDDDESLGARVDRWWPRTQTAPPNPVPMPLGAVAGYPGRDDDSFLWLRHPCIITAERNGVPPVPPPPPPPASPGAGAAGPWAARPRGSPDHHGFSPFWRGAPSIHLPTYIPVCGADADRDTHRIHLTVPSAFHPPRAWP